MTWLAEFCVWLAKRDWAMDFSGSTLLYPVVLTTHLACIAVFGGLILLTNLRLLGWALTDFPISDVIGKFRFWKRLGGVVMVACGVLLAGSEANKYYTNPYFWTKMVLLGLLVLHGLVFRPIVYLNTAELDRAPAIPGKAKLAAALSLVLWISVATMGRMIGYFEGPSQFGLPLIGPVPTKQSLSVPPRRKTADVAMDSLRLRHRQPRQEPAQDQPTEYHSNAEER